MNIDKDDLTDDLIEKMSEILGDPLKDCQEEIKVAIMKTINAVEIRARHAKGIELRVESKEKIVDGLSDQEKLSIAIGGLKGYAYQDIGGSARCALREIGEKF